MNYQYKEINSLIEGNSEVKIIIDNIKNNESLNYDSFIFNNIISKLNKEELINLDKKLGKSYSSSLWEAKFEEITINGKKIKIYKEFILVNEKIFKLFNINFGISSRKEINYFYKDGDIISIYDYFQCIILFGNINIENNYYDIKYIFDLKNKSSLNEELDNIKKLGIDNYINNFAIFSGNNDKDYISPIFAYSRIVGYCYKYNPDIDYNTCFNYCDYLDNLKLFKLFKIYFNNYMIAKKMKEKNNNNNEEKYYLINKDYLSNIKKDLNYDEIKKIFDDNKLYESEYLDDKKVLKIIKNLPIYKIDNYFGENVLKYKYKKEYMEPNIIPLNDNNIDNSKLQIMIYDNFEIFEKNILELFVDDINGNENNFLKCFFCEGKIIINYPYNINKNYVSVIGTLNKKNNFIKNIL